MSGRRGRDPAARAERRAALLDAAVRVVRRDGPRPSMEAIAREAGITKPILYRHFGDRSGLIGAVARRYADELGEALRTSITGVRDPRAGLVEVIDTYLAVVERDPALHRFVLEGVGSGSVAGLEGFLQSLGHRVAVVLGEQLRAAGRDSGGAEPLAHGLVGFVHAAGAWWAAAPAMPRAQLTAYLTELLWGGLGELTAPRLAAVPDTTPARRRAR